MLSLTTQRTFFIVLAGLAMAACTDAPPSDEAAFEEPALLAAKADGAGAYDNWTFFKFVERDLRRCMSPLCGGMYVARVNQSKIKCADGTWQKKCYVAAYDFSAIASGEEVVALAEAASAGRLLVRGGLEKGFYPEFPEVAVLAVTEAWQAPTDKAATGIFYRAHDLGIMCFTTPCLTVELTRLNRNASPVSRVAGADLTGSGASDNAISDAQQERDGSILVAGRLKRVTGPAGAAKKLIASQFYTRYASATVGRACGGRAGACSEGFVCQFEDALCGAADGQGVCQAKPAACTEQYEPVCGCDGVTYDNDCSRKAFGAGFATPGECRVARGCRIGGCRGELCTNASQELSASICIERATDHCYRELGVCEPQGLDCGWTMSPELAACIEKATTDADQNP